MTTLLSSAAYPSIRAAIDITLGTADLPDSVISLPIYLDAADLELKARDPLWASRTGDSLISLMNAAVYLTAARIAPAMPQLLSETFGDYRYQVQAVDWAARAAALRALAETALDMILDVGDVTSDRPTRFAVAGGRRGRW